MRPRLMAPILAAAALLIAFGTAAHAQAPARVAAPTMVRATDTGDGNVRVVWARVPAATGYEIRRLVPSVGTWAVVGRVAASDTTYVDAGRDLGEPHRYAVAAMVNAAISAITSSPIVRPAPAGTPRANVRAEGATPPVDELPVTPTTPTTSATVDPNAKSSVDRCNDAPVYQRAICWGPETVVRGPVSHEGARARVECPRGMFATGGGFAGNFGHATVTESTPEIFGWAVQVHALPGTAPANNETRFRAYVSCAKAGAR